MFTLLFKIIKYPLRIVSRQIDWARVYSSTLALLYPINLILSVLRRNIYNRNSVLHISYMVHVPYYTVNLLRQFGMKADYLAVGTSPYWNKCDYQMVHSARPGLQAWNEFKLFWQVVARYQIIHLHFMIPMSLTGWELAFLKRMGRKLVIHYRGCEIRNRERNMALHPHCNICQECDYNATICTSEVNRKRRALAAKYGDLFLVTTPDLKDFVPTAEYFPFFTPELDSPVPMMTKKDALKIVHVTGHPGIEGTRYIDRAIKNLRAKGFKLDFVFLKDVSHAQVLDQLRDADLSIGKMKMGHYANAQIEAMVMGVPTITYVRPEFMTKELEESGFIFSTLDDLETTLEYYLTHPAELEYKRQIARSSILRLHDNAKLARRLIELYQNGER